MWATALHPVPPKKRPCAILARKVGRSTNTPLRSAVLAAAARIWLSVSRWLDNFLWPQRAFPTPGGLVDRPAPEAPLIRGMPLAFLGNATRLWATALRLDPPKKALCHTFTFGGAWNKYHHPNGLVPHPGKKKTQNTQHFVNYYVIKP